ncbi:hypothetical protein [Parasitella parasitica]|uniref:Uncharacterized protein n=1 Tax=Parasitella parasitica TaxID=35722 RepID=A0A0B7N7G1_9FUNG|nr:hypothetical protein [Parasitella parasitica]
MYNSIHFPPSTISSKLSSKLLKKPPSPTDWMHQSYMELIQDMSFVTIHYYESKDNGSNILEASVPEPRKNAIKCEESINSSPSMSKQQFLYETTADNEAISSLYNSASTSLQPSSSKYQRDRLQEEEEQDMTTDEDDNNEFNTITTSSTDCNRRNNIYRLHKEQQNIAKTINEMENEDPAIFKVATPHNSNHDNTFASEKSDSSVCIDPLSPHDHEIQLVNQQPQQIPKKRLKLIGKLITNMRITAEKPFWSIDDHFCSHYKKFTQSANPTVTEDDFDILLMTLPLRPGSDLFSNNLLRDQSIKNIIITAIIGNGTTGDDYSVSANEQHGG